MTKIRELQAKIKEELAACLRFGFRGGAKAIGEFDAHGISKS